MSTEDYTTSEKAKLSNIEAGAEVNVQADWNQSDSNADDYIKNKPTIKEGTGTGSIIENDTNNIAGGTNSHAEGYLTKAVESFTHVNGVGTEAHGYAETVIGQYNDYDAMTEPYVFVIGNGYEDGDRSNAHTTDWQGNAWYAGEVTDGTGNVLSEKVDKETGKGLSTNDYTTAEKNKLSGIESGAEANVQTDWNQSDSSADDYLKNKPPVPSVDSTLSTNGAAADAKVTGDEITGLKSDFANFTNLSDTLIDDTNYIINLDTAFKQGVVHNRAYSNPDTTDTITTYSNLFRKKYLPFNLHVDIANGYKALMVFYSSDVDTSAITGTWLTGNNTVVDTVSTLSEDYFCIEVRKTGNTAITPSEATNAVSVYYSMPLLADRKKVVNIQADSTSALTITETCDICGNGHTINVGQNAEFGLHILGDTGVVVNVYDLTIKGGYESAVRVNHFATVNFYNCSFEGATNHGLSVINSNTNCFDCIAQNNGVDGFNYHLKGKNTVYNCNGINNGDDGISNHEESSLKIVGGRFTGNGKAGIACPTYGASNTEILDVYCADNVQYGILAHNDTALTDKVIVQNAIITGSPKGATIRGYQAIFNNVKFADCTTNTETGNGGTITAM